MAVSQVKKGDVIAKKYELDSLLGQGPAGQTWAARALSTQKKVVVKILNVETTETAPVQAMFDRIRAVKADTLPAMLDVGIHGDHPYVVQEYSDGESLRQLMDQYAKEQRFFSLQEAAAIVVKVLEAADAAHRAGLIHRHIKPTNVLVQSRAVGPGQSKTVRSVVLTGLGLAEMLPASAFGDIQERGDHRYMGPELESPITGGGPQTDVYSCGVLLYELLTGQTPRGTYLSPSQIREDLPAGVDDIVDLALASNPEDRFPTARDMINAIQRSFQEDAPAESGVSRRLIVTIAAATLVLLAIMTAALYTNDPLAAAKKSDETVRAQLVKTNPLPDEATMREKLVGHADMTYIPAGTFLRGRLNAESQNVAKATEPLAQVTKTKAYYIDRLEWPNVKGEHPVVNVTLSVASDMCASAGKRLCSSEEWERACKGPESKVYTYGDTYNDTACGGDTSVDADKDGKSDRTAGSLEKCVSGWGVFDMSGGVREWTSSPDPSQARFRQVKGGKTGDPESGSRCAYADSRNPELTDRTIGFRCCIDADAAVVVPAPAPADGAAAPDGAAAATGATPDAAGATPAAPGAPAGAPPAAPSTAPAHP